MMSKKILILEAALGLFSTKGFSATTTRNISKTAGVSEGLIFRHFKNKEGLFQALVENNETLNNLLFEPILKLEHPKVFLKQVLSIPFQLKGEQFALWRMIYSQQWFREDFYQKSMQPIKENIIKVFKNLNNEDPDAEAQTFFLILDGIIFSVLMLGTAKTFPVFENILRKFDL